MIVDTQQPYTPIAAVPNRSVHTPPDQASARPVERPHHVEGADNQTTKQATTSSEAQKEAQRPPSEGRIRQEAELSPDEKRELDKLKARDREVRAHEAAHKSVASNLARGSASYTMETGPDGRHYAVGGEVNIDTSKVAGDPEATIRKAQTIRRAANAPAQPSAQDRRVAAEATQMEAEARQELTAQQLAERQDSGDESVSAGQSGLRIAITTEPAPVGELLDVKA